MDSQTEVYAANPVSKSSSMLDYSQIGQRIKRIRNQRGMTQEALAEAASLSVPYISHLERAVKRGSLETLMQIAAVLEISANELLGISTSGENAFLPDLALVLEDCSPEERKFLLDVAVAIKKIMRQEKQ